MTGLAPAKSLMEAAAAGTVVRTPSAIYRAVTCVKRRPAVARAAVAQTLAACLRATTRIECPRPGRLPWCSRTNDARPQRWTRALPRRTRRHREEARHPRYRAGNRGGRCRFREAGSRHRHIRAARPRQGTAPWSRRWTSSTCRPVGSPGRQRLHSRRGIRRAPVGQHRLALEARAPSSRVSH